MSNHPLISIPLDIHDIRVLQTELTKDGEFIHRYPGVAQMSANDQHPLDFLIGEQMSAVVFVRDYVQLVFDGPGLTAITSPIVKVRGESSRWEDPGYRDKLCECIGKVVRRASVIENEEINIEFDDENTSILISLRPEDYVTAEAAIFSYADRLWVW